MTETNNAPKKWKIIFSYPQGHLSAKCGECILKNHFNVRADKIQEHLNAIRRDGQDSVYFADKDAAGTKMDEVKRSIFFKPLACQLHLRCMELSLQSYR